MSFLEQAPLTCVYGTQGPRELFFFLFLFHNLRSLNIWAIVNKAPGAETSYPYKLSWSVSILIVNLWFILTTTYVAFMES